MVPPSGGSLEIGNAPAVQLHHHVGWYRSPFGGIPRNWKHALGCPGQRPALGVPPSGGSLEIGNVPAFGGAAPGCRVPPSGGSLEIGNAGT